MSELRFSLYGPPSKATAQQKGVCVIGGRPKFFVKAKVRREAETLAALLLPHRPAEPFCGPLQVSLEWHFPYRASERRGIVRAGVPIAHDKRPDLDNLEKGLLDTMTRLGFWADDGQIAWKQTRKLWSARPRIDIFVFEMNARREFPAASAGKLDGVVGDSGGDA